MKGLTIAILIILILMLLSFGGYAGYHFATGGISTVFADVAIFVVALVGVLIALASLGIWMALRRILHEDIAREISRVEEATRHKALSRMAVKVATAFWTFYEDTQKIVFREQAIKIISDAHKILEGREEVESEEALKCRIYNNSAFAYAERGNKEDTAIAHYLTNYTRERGKDFPEHEVDYLETYAYVLYRLPKKNDDKQKALGIINELLERPDIKEEAKHKYRQRYSLPDIKADHQPNLDNK